MRIREGVGIGAVDGHAIENLAAGCLSIVRAWPGEASLSSCRHDPARGAGDLDPRGVGDATLLVGGVVGRRLQWWANTESRRIPGSQDGRGRLGERGEPHALNDMCFATSAFGHDPSAQVKDAPQRRPGINLAKFEGDGPGEQVGPGAVPVVDASSDDPRVPARMTGEGRTARPDVAVGKGEEGFVDTLVLDVESLHGERPARLGGDRGKSPLAPPAQLGGQQLVQACRASREYHHPGPRRTPIAVHQHDRRGPYVRGDYGSGTVGHARQPVHHHQDLLWADSPPPKFFEHF